MEQTINSLNMKYLSTKLKHFHSYHKSFMNENNDKKISIISNQSSLYKHTFNEFIKITNDITYFYSKIHQDYNEQKLHFNLLSSDINTDVIYLFTKSSELQNDIRKVIIHLNRDVTIIIVKENDSEVPNINQQKGPILVYSPPMVGTNRFMPVLLDYFRHHEIVPYPRKLTLDNPSYCQRLKEKDPIQAYRDNNLIYRSNILTMNYFKFHIIHDFIDLEYVTKDIQLKCVIIIRDPRDIINSYYHRLHFNNSFVHNENSIDDDLIQIINGGIFQLKNDYFLYWPPIEEITRSYVYALANKQNNIISFEKVHEDPKQTYSSLFAKLNIENGNSKYSFPENKLNEAIEKSSFKYQTNGKRVRGNERKTVHVSPNTGLQTSCRKGVPGDWKNHFSQKVCNTLKDKIGDDLIDLGYENTLDW